MSDIYQSKFFVAYPRQEESEVKSIINQIASRLKISYDLWSYSNVEDEYDYFEKYVSPTIEKVDFVLIFVSRDAVTDYIVAETSHFCSNLNKRVMAIKVGSGRVRSKEWNFRSDILDFTKESDKISIIEQIHGWLGLRKIGDVYGANVTIKANIPCVVYRGKEVLGQINQNGSINCVLAEGQNYLIFRFGNEWNEYKCFIKNNDSDVEFQASLTGTQALSKRYSLPKSTNINKSLTDEWNWDITGRNDFVLISSSQDEKKRNVIIESYENYYINNRIPYAEILPPEIKSNKTVEIIAWILSIIVGINTFFIPGIIMIWGFYKLRNLKDKLIIKAYEQQKKDNISNTDRWNKNLLEKTTDAMNEALSERHLAEAWIKDLGTPSRNYDRNN